MANTVIRWNPFRELASMQSLLDRAFDDTWRNWPSTFEQGNVNTGMLPLDIHENDNAYIVTAAVPGVQPDNINIKLHNDFLTIEGEIPAQTMQQEGSHALLQERFYGRFSRTIRLPQPVSRDNVDATFDQGVLTLTLPKAPEAQPRSIPVKLGNNMLTNNGSGSKN